MKRKREGKSGTESSPKTASDASTSSPSNGEDTPPHNTPPVANPTPAVPEPPLPPPEPEKAASAAAPPAASSNPAAEIPYTKPKMAVVYGRVKLKFKSSKAAEPSHSPSEAKAPADAGKSQTAAPETGKQVTTEKGVVAPLDRQTADGQVLELTGSDKEKVGKKGGIIKLLSAGLSPSARDGTQDREADEVAEPLPGKQETVLVNDESDNASEPRNSQESEVKQSTPDRQRDEKELAAALEAIKKVMKVDSAEPFNVPVDPVALGIPDYLDVIDTPMDFGTICQDLEHGNKYMNSEDVYKDVQFIWDNCVKYNSKGDYIIELMKRVKKAFMKNWLAAGLYSDVQDNGGNDTTGDEDAKVTSKSKSKQKRRRPGNDRHKDDCSCAVCQVTRRKKERVEILSVDNETTVTNNDISEEQSMEVNFGVNNSGSHDTPSSQEKLQHTDVYKAMVEVDAQTQMKDLGKFLKNPSPDYEDEGSRQYSEEKEEVEYKDLNNQDEHTSAQPNGNSEVEHHQQKARTETSQEVEMEDFPIQQENQSFLQLCARLFPSKRSSAFRGRHSLFRQQRRVAAKESPLHAAMTTIMKR
ncbi:bromodomain-containing factor 1 [Lolium rigidum]|uniref:bromodomain-containing factor 1 n=1 Tax=Lolium rigidum TaxID=89674 RepID=UPI001F5C7E90|nr:bromodomain-containing factor 1 [Lolium rigidum]XP_047080469.1 bromodomain-containing factor 1 [Lolium rigidum]